MKTMATTPNIRIARREAPAGKIRMAILPWLLVAGLPFVNGCALLLAGAATGAVTGLEYSYDNTSRKTVTKHIDVLQEALLMALEEMAIVHALPEKTAEGLVIQASTTKLDIKIDLERITDRATKITVNANKNVFVKDPATAAEIVRRTEEALPRAAVLIAKRNQFAQASGMGTVPSWQPELWLWVYATSGERATELSLYMGRGDFPKLGPAAALVPMKKEHSQAAEQRSLPPRWQRGYWRWVYATTGEPETELSFYTGRGDFPEVGPATAMALANKKDVAPENNDEPSPTTATAPSSPPPGIPVFRTARGEGPWSHKE